MKKKAAITILVLVLIAAAGAGLYFFVFKDKMTPAEDKVFVQSVASLQSYGGYGNRYSGIVETQKSEKVEFAADQKLKEIFVAEGDHVAEGDPLFSYDTELIALEIDQLNLEIERLNTMITNNNTQIEQLTKDMEKVADADRLEYTATIAELQTDIAQSQYDIKTKQAEILKKQTSIENATVFAKSEGTIQSIADVDAILSGTSFDSNGNPDNTFITIRAEGDFRIKGRISETNINGIWTGEEMIARSRVTDQVWKGTITSIDTQTTDDNNQNMYYSYGAGESASKYAFYVDLESTEGLMLGQHLILEADQSGNKKAEGLWLTRGWLVEEDGAYYVWAAKKEGAKLEKRAVTLGDTIEETDEVQISGGLSESEFIAWPDASCREGAPTTSEYVIPEENESLPVDGGEDLSMEETVPEIFPEEVMEPAG